VTERGSLLDGSAWRQHTGAGGKKARTSLGDSLLPHVWKGHRSLSGAGRCQLESANGQKLNFTLLPGEYHSDWADGQSILARRGWRRILMRVTGPTFRSKFEDPPSYRLWSTTWVSSTRGIQLGWKQKTPGYDQV